MIVREIMRASRLRRAGIRKRGLKWTHYGLLGPQWQVTVTARKTSIYPVADGPGANFRSGDGARTGEQMIS